MTRALVLALLGSIGTCAPRSGQPPVETDPAGADASSGPTASAPATPTIAPVSSVISCDTARCWLERADEAERRGALDVAAAHHGRAYAAEPAAERLFAWVDALVAAGELRRARAALDDARTLARATTARRPAFLRDPAILARLDARLADLPAPVPPAPAPPLSADLRAAYDLAAAGRLDDAAGAFSRALAGDPEPAHLAAAGALQWTRGQPDEARRLWSRARARIHERGGAIDVVAVETWFTSQLLWRGDDLALVRRFTPALDVMARPAGALDLMPAQANAPFARRLHFERPPNVVAFSDDGRTLVRDDDKWLVFQDMSSGTILQRIATDDAIARLAVVGAGEAMFVLAAHGAEVSLWNGRGEALQRFRLQGTTPTITRVYTGEDTYHHNILKDSPTWPVALALTADAGLVAIGGSDAKVRLFDRTRGRERELAFTWRYTERRHMGGNPDLNQPLDLRFVAGGAQLVAIHTHGDLLRWDTARGALVRHIPGTCTAAEARPVVNRHGEPGAPQRAATDEERESCGRAVAGVFSPDGTRVATGGGLQGIRIRDASTGAPLAMLVGEQLPDYYLALARSGALAGGDIYGALSLVPAGARQPTALVPPHPSGPTDPTISATGRHLQFHLQHHAHVWDLVARRRLDLTGPKEQLLALAPAGDFAVVHTGDAIEIREVPGGAARFRAPTRASAFSSRAQFAGTSGHVLLVTDDDRGRTAVLVALPAGTSTPVRVPVDQQQLWLSPDARWLATSRQDQPAKIWRLATAELVATLEDHVRHIAFAADGASVVWLRQTDPRRPGGRARLRRLDEPAPADMPEVTYDGWSDWLALAPAGDEVMILGQNGEAIRWRPATGARTVVKDLGLAMARRVHYADDGKTLLFEGYGRVLIRANDAGLTPLAALAPLLSGGWLAVSVPGALDGSDDAPLALISRVHGAGEAFVHDGRLAWDALHVPGVVTRALAGEALGPPLPLGSAHPQSAPMP